MKTTIKYLGWTNFVGLLATNTCLIAFLSSDKDAWGSFYVLINLLITIPFIVLGIISIRNAEKPNEKLVNKTLYAVFFILWIPSLILPFTYELGGLVVCVSILLLGLWGKFKMKNLLARLVFLNAIGFIFLILNSIIIFRFK